MKTIIESAESIINFLLSPIQRSDKRVFFLKNTDVWILAIKGTRDSNYCYHFFIEIQLF